MGRGGGLGGVIWISFQAIDFDKFGLTYVIHVALFEKVIIYCKIPVICPGLISRRGCL